MSHFNNTIFLFYVNNVNPKVGQKCKTFGDALHSGRFFLFILFVVLSHYSGRICSFPRFYFSKPVTIAQKGFLHDTFVLNRRSFSFGIDTGTTVRSVVFFYCLYYAEFGYLGWNIRLCRMAFAAKPRLG